MNPLVSTFARFGSRPIDKPLADVLAGIREGKNREYILHLRGLYAPDRALYNREKKMLPTFIVSGTANTRKEPVQHSNLLQVDLDRLGAKLDEVRASVKCDPHVAFGFLSPSGDGLKLGVVIDGERHADSFHAVEAYFRNRYGLTIDGKCKPRLHLCFESFDPELWVNDEATQLLIETQQVPTQPQQPPPNIRLNPV